MFSRQACQISKCSETNSYTSYSTHSDSGDNRHLSYWDSLFAAGVSREVIEVDKAVSADALEYEGKF